MAKQRFYSQYLCPSVYRDCVQLSRCFMRHERVCNHCTLHEGCSDRKVSSSDFFRNYRHTMNALTIQNELVNRGVLKERVRWKQPCERQIVLMIADEMSCTARNKNYGRIDSVEGNCDLYNFWCYAKSRLEDSTIAYHGSDVTVDSFLGVLTSDLYICLLS